MFFVISEKKWKNSDCNSKNKDDFFCISFVHFIWHRSTFYVRQAMPIFMRRHDYNLEYRRSSLHTSSFGEAKNI